ncbi:DHA2 family efflux MFS transporter permease subunit [Acidipropionibacterium virtanenii]|nr:DHA2 family efflux MFS transporter permease subunit [Acidipropionibacterium virtanenii]
MSDSQTFPAPRDPRLNRPWPAMWSILVGFFMMMIDASIVTVALPRMQKDLHADLTLLAWVTSAYLLPYAALMLITGRLGDRLGLKRVYMTGLGVFTVASLLCGLSTTAGMLIASRALQGVGAAIVSPQTMSMVTRIFPPDGRGRAMAIWGATGGVANIIGPLLGGVLVDGPGWQWIFYVNLPVGVLGMIAAARFVPALAGSANRLDWTGALLSAVGLGLLVFGVQEGQRYSWGAIAGVMTVPRLIVVGLGLLVVFVFWQARMGYDALVPLRLFADRNFSAAVGGIAAMGAIVFTQNYPLTMFLQNVRMLSPTRAALMTLPVAVVSIVLANPVGHWLDGHDPKPMALTGFGCMIAGLSWLSLAMSPRTPIPVVLAAMTVIGVGNALIWSPLSVAATANLSPTLAGAGAGLYSEMQQVAAVLGSAGIATLMTWRAGVRDDLALAMGDSMWLSVGLAAAGLIACLCFVRPRRAADWAQG